MSTQELAGAQAEKEGLQMALTALERRNRADQDKAQREAAELAKVCPRSSGSPGLDVAKSFRLTSLDTSEALTRGPEVMAPSSL